MMATMFVVQGRPKGKYLSFPDGEYLIGRGDECHVRPVSPWVSRQHCLLQISTRGVLVRDLGSSNGTLINGRRVVGEHQLRPGDQLQVGPLVLQLVDPADVSRDPLTDTPVPEMTGRGVDSRGTTELQFVYRPH